MPTIDSDAHVVETEHTWDFMDPADQKYRPLIVRPRGEEGEEYWFIDGKIRGLVRVVLTAQQLAEVSERTGRVMHTPRETREMENVPARLRHMDELGIDIQVLYPTIFIEQVTDKPEWEIAICEDNITIGTDYGHNDQSTEVEALRNLKKIGTITSRQYEKITYHNPKALFGLT